MQGASGAKGACEVRIRGESKREDPFPRTNHPNITPSKLCSTASETTRGRVTTMGATMTGATIIDSDAVEVGVVLSVMPDGAGLVDDVGEFVGLARLELESDGYRELVLDTDGVAPGLSAGVGVPVDVRVPVSVGVTLGVPDGEGVALAVVDRLAPNDTGGVGVPVPDGVVEDVALRVGVPVPVKLGVRVTDCVTDGDAPCESVAVGVRVGVRTAEGVDRNDGDGDGPPEHASAAGALHPVVVHALTAQTEEDPQSPLSDSRARRLSPPLCGLRSHTRSLAFKPRYTRLRVPRATPAHAGIESLHATVAERHTRTEVVAGEVRASGDDADAAVLPLQHCSGVSLAATGRLSPHKYPAGYTKIGGNVGAGEGDGGGGGGRHVSTATELHAVVLHSVTFK